MIGNGIRWRRTVQDRVEFVRLGVALILTIGLALVGTEPVAAGAGTQAVAESPQPSALAAMWQDEAQRRYEAADLPGALAALKRALRAAPDDAQLHFMKGNAQFRLGRWNEAAKSYERAAGLRPQHPDTWLGAGFAHFYAGRIDSAVLAWEEAVRQSPPCAICRLGLALGYAELDEPYFAALQLQIARQARPDCDSVDALALDVRWRPEAIAALRQIRAPAEAGAQDD